MNEISYSKDSKAEKMLKKAMKVVDDYLNAGFKEERTLAHNKAKKLYKEYYGVEYKNREERR